MTIKVVIVLFSLHIIAGFTALAFGPEACEEGDFSCGDSTVTEFMETDLESEDQEEQGGILGSIGRSLANVVGQIWNGIGGVASVVFNLTSFNHPWLDTEGMPELAAYIVWVFRGVMFVIHVVLFVKLLLAGLGRGI